MPEVVIHQMPEHNNEEKEAKIWKSCCFSINKEVVVFITQNLIGVLIIVFCIVKLNDDLDCSEQQTFISLLTFIAGILLPNPKFTK
jgi:hypothetical protein